MPQRQVPPGGFDWENGKKMAEERLQKGKNIADGCVGQLKRVAENQTITDKLKKISKKTIKPFFFGAFLSMPGPSLL